MNARPRMVMLLYGPIEFDGRVRRAADALADDFDLTVLTLDRHAPATNGRYRTEPVHIPRRWLRGPARYAWFCTVAGRRVRQLRPDVVYAHDYYLVGPGARLARRAAARLVYDAHELIIPTPGQRPSLRERYFYACERRHIHTADLVIAANHRRAELMQQHYRLAECPLVIRNLPVGDLSVLSSRQDHPRLACCPPGTVRCLYQGDLGPERGLSRFIAAMEHLDERFHLLIVGGGAGEAPLRRRAHRSPAAERIHFLGRVPHHELLALSAACHVGLMAYPSAVLNHVYCAPNKVFEYAAVGLPAVAFGSHYLCDLINGAGIGIALAVAEASPQRLADCIRQVEARRAALAENGSRFASANRWADEADRLRRAILQRLDSPAGHRREVGPRRVA